VPITTADGDFRYAGGVAFTNSADGEKYLACVREAHGIGGVEGAAGVANEIVAVKLSGDDRGAVTVLISGRDFYGSPTVSADGSSLAATSWDHPNMPWDDIQLLVLRDLPAALGGAAAAPEVVVDGAAEGSTESIVEPRFGPDNLLYFYGDRSDLYSLYRLNVAGGAAEPELVLSAEGKDLIGPNSLWVMGTQSYDFTPDGKKLVAALPSAPAALAFVDLDDITSKTLSEGLPDHVNEVLACADGSVLLSGGSCSSPDMVYRWVSGAPLVSLYSTVDDADMVEPAWVPVPEKVEFETTFEGAAATAHGWYYPPTNPDVDMREVPGTDAAPPLLVKAHGGPHGAAKIGYRLDIAFWTSRGWAVLDVDYGGSMGYGRRYRQRLTHPQPNWGVVDQADVAAGAAWCASTGRAAPGRCVIEGGSAGGYTTLAALVFGDAFQGGCSMYGVADLKLLASDTHKFESRYLDRLVGALPEAGAVYDERSPLQHCENLNAPLLLLQGDEDKIVPPNQAERMYEVLMAKKLPTALVMFEGEQHGFRKQENIEKVLNYKLYFFSKLFGISTADDLGEPFVIQNLKNIPEA